MIITTIVEHNTEKEIIIILGQPLKLYSLKIRTEGNKQFTSHFHSLQNRTLRLRYNNKVVFKR